MPIFGLGIHVIIAFIFAIHAVRSGRNLYWLIILFSFPLLGSLAYFVVEYLPGSRMNRSVGKAASAAASMLDPQRELREARNAFDLSPSAQNRMRLAKALLARGDAHAAIEHFDACLKGPFGKDPEFLYAAASAKLQDGQIQPALELAKALRATVPDYLAERAILLLARAYAAAGEPESARAEYAAAVERFNSVEARAQYAIWAAGANDLACAKKLYDELAHSARHWNANVRSMNRPLLDQVERAIAGR